MVFVVDETEVFPFIFSSILVENTEITIAIKNKNTIISVNAFLEACPAILRSKLSSTKRRPTRLLQNFFWLKIFINIMYLVDILKIGS